MQSSTLLASLAASGSAYFAAAQVDEEIDVNGFMTTRALQATPTSLSPQQIASMASVSSAFAAAITNPIQQGGARAGDAASIDDGSGDLAGASGGEQNSITISKGGIIAIAVVVSCVVIFGISSTILFYLAKKRSWKVRTSIRRSAKKVATALTPRRTTFPKNVMDEQPGKKNKRQGMSRIEEVPPTPRLTNHDVEKAHAKADAIEMREPSKVGEMGKARGDQ